MTERPTKRVDWIAQHFPETKDRREYGGVKCIVACMEMFAAAMESAGMTPCQVDDRLGKRHGYTTRALRGTLRVTLRALGELLWACGAEVTLAGPDNEPAEPTLRLIPFGTVVVYADEYPELRDAAPISHDCLTTTGGASHA